jgi:hypothetical protein
MFNPLTIIVFELNKLIKICLVLKIEKCICRKKKGSING